MEQQVFVFKGTAGGLEVKGDRAIADVTNGGRVYRVYDGSNIVAQFEAPEVVGWWRKDAAEFNPYAGT